MGTNKLSVSYVSQAQSFPSTKFVFFNLVIKKMFYIGGNILHLYSILPVHVVKKR